MVELLTNSLSRYDKADTSKISLVDIQFLCAMGPPGGGRNTINKRFSRHFNICSMNTFSDETMTQIFSTIISVSLRERNFPLEYLTTGSQIVAATLDMYKSVITCLLPTPTKSHYVFNLRDFSRVILGTLLVEPPCVENRSTFIRLVVGCCGLISIIGGSVC